MFVTRTTKTLEVDIVKGEDTSTTRDGINHSQNFYQAIR